MSLTAIESGNHSLSVLFEPMPPTFRGLGDIIDSLLSPVGKDDFLVTGFLGGSRVPFHLADKYRVDFVTGGLLLPESTTGPLVNAARAASVATGNYWYDDGLETFTDGGLGSDEDVYQLKNAANVVLATATVGEGQTLAGLSGMLSAGINGVAQVDYVGGNIQITVSDDNVSSLVGPAGNPAFPAVGDAFGSLEYWTGKKIGSSWNFERFDNNNVKIGPWALKSGVLTRVTPVGFGDRLSSGEHEAGDVLEMVISQSLGRCVKFVQGTVGEGLTVDKILVHVATFETKATEFLT